MMIPIHKQGKILIVTFQGTISDTQLLELQENLLAHVIKHRSKGVLIDVSTLDVIDSFACRTLRNMASVLKLRGVDAIIIVGVGPEVAFTMVQMGLTFNNMEPALDLEEGLELLSARVN